MLVSFFFILPELTLNELMEQLCPVSSSPISHRWYMLGILLEVEKSILNTISRAFAASGNFKYALQEVIGSWLERKYKPKKFRTSGMAKLRDAVCRMGYEKLARDLGELYLLQSSSSIAIDCIKIFPKLAKWQFPELANSAIFQNWQN